MGPVSRILPVFLALVHLAGPVWAGDLAPEALATARGSHRRCVEQLEALQAERNPFCVALFRRDPSMCSRVPVAGQPACRVLTGVRRWVGILLRPCRMIPLVGDRLERRCPATLPPGILVDDAPCRRLLLSHVILPQKSGRADVLVKMVNPFDEVARCDLQLSASHNDHDAEARSLEVEFPPRSPLDRRIPIRYDAGTQVDVHTTCAWDLRIGGP